MEAFRGRRLGPDHGRGPGRHGRARHGPGTLSEPAARARRRLGRGGRARADLRRSRRGGAGARAGNRSGGRVAVGYSVARREEAADWMAQYPGFGEMRWYSGRARHRAGLVQLAAGCPRTPVGGAPTATATRARRRSTSWSPGRSRSRSATRSSRPRLRPAVRMTGEAFYSVHNDSDADAQLLIFSTRLAEPVSEQQEDFWPG